MPTGDVEITILDNGAGTVVVPASSVAVVIGACSGGVAAQVVASRNANTLAAAVGSGPAVDKAAMIIAAGGTVLFMKSATTTPGVASAVVSTLKLGTSVITVTGAPFDSYLVKVRVTNGGTIAANGIRFQISLDAGRNWGIEIALGTANTYAIVGTGLTLAFAAGTLLLGDTITFGCTEPLTTSASVQACLVALEASPYATTGWGSLNITGPRSGTDASSIQGYLDTMVATKTWPRAIIEVRDCALPVAYGGAGETDAAWSTAIATDYSAVSAKRICAVAGNYNMNSMFPIASAGTPRMRRNGAYALACRQVQIKPQTHAGRVSDGAIAQIIVDPTNDSFDGFNYHDDFNAPSLDVARFTSFRRRKGKPGFFVKNPKLMSPLGSFYTMLPIGNVSDIACSILNQVTGESINSDVRVNTNGTIDEKAAQAIEITVREALRAQMLAKSMISDFVFAIDRSTNVKLTSTVNWASTIITRGYVLEIDGTVGLL